MQSSLKSLRYANFSQKNLVTEEGNIRRPGPVPKFSDLEVIALSLTAESESMDSEKVVIRLQIAGG